MGQTKTPETVKRLMPSSWTEVAIWAVIAVVFATHPAASTRFVSKAVWGTGTWIGYHAFADCGTPPPFTWMDPKPCPTGPEEGDTQPAAVQASDGGEAAPYGIHLPTQDQVWAKARDLRDTSRERIIEPGSGPSNETGA